MPAAMKAALMKAGKKKGLSGAELDDFVYGIMNKEGYMKGSKTTKKGKAWKDKK
jgi:hypothetical protein